MRFSLLAAPAAILLATTTPAWAEDLRQARISYGDLDLANAAGAERLKQRVKAAVRSVCETNDRTIRSKVREQSCIRTSSASALESVARAVNRAQQPQARSNVGAAITVTR